MAITKPQVLVLGGNFAGLASAQKNRDPAKHQRMQLRPVLADDDIHFIQAAVKHVDIVSRTVDFLPSERPGEECQSLHYDYLVTAMGAHLAYDRIPGFEDAMAVMSLPEKYRKRLRTTNMQERLSEEVRRRERVIRIFHNDESALRLIGALLAEQNEVWQERRYLDMDDLNNGKQQEQHPLMARISSPLSAKETSIY